MALVLIGRPEEIAALRVPHPTDEILEEYYFKRLDPARQNEVDEHLLWCEECQDRLAATERFVRDIRPALASPAPARSRLRNFWQFIPNPVLAGAFALILLCGLVLLRPGHAVRDYEETTLVTMRGAEGTHPVQVPIARRTTLHLDVVGVTLPVIYRVEVVNSDGTVLINQVGSSPVCRIEKPLQPGTYFVRLNTAEGDALREYVFQAVP